VKRRLIKQVCALLVAGAIVTIAVAWTFACFGPAKPTGFSSGAGYKPRSAIGVCGWDVFMSASWCAVRLDAYPRQKSMLPQPWNEANLYPTWSNWSQWLDAIAAAPPNSADSSQPAMTFPGAQSFDARGWPMLSMQAHWNGSDTAHEHVHRWRWGIALSGNVVKSAKRIAYGDLKVLPLRPMWPGFVVNTLFYAAIVWLIFLAPFQLRRASRTRRGRCSACGYPIGASPVCTECGAAIPAKSQQPASRVSLPTNGTPPNR